MRSLCLLVLLCPALAAGANRMTSARAEADHELSADPDSAWWRSAPGVSFDTGRYGERITDLRTEVRSRWTGSALYFLFECRYDNLNSKPGNPAAGETNELWNWDVAEVFIGSDFTNIRTYKEFEVSPRGEWVDLSIELGASDKDHKIDWNWNSGFTNKTRIDEARKIWYLELRIPIAAIAPWKPEPGRKFRLNLYRIQGNPARYLAWRPVNQDWFHNPAAFGTLVLTK